jgi:hypothetical protein
LEPASNPPPRRFEIQPVLDSTLPEVVSFLDRAVVRNQGGAPRSTEQWVRWLLIENPLSSSAARHGLCIRDASGVLMGLLLSFPAALLAGDRRLAGLGSGSFFVEPPARTLGFHLFKRHLNAPGASFFFATSCNVSSAPLWKAMGGHAVPGSDIEYVFPLRLDVLLPAFLARTSSSRLAATGARLLGRCANILPQFLARTPATLAIEPCRDWEKLEELFRRHRPADVITTDRTAAFLRWRYAETAPNYPFDVCVVRDAQGREGWFALGTVPRGREGEFRGSMLLDAAWPRDTMRFADIFRAIVSVAASRADAVYFQPRPRVDFRQCSRWLIPRRLEAAKAFVVTPKGAAPLATAALDLVSADGDLAF